MRPDELEPAVAGEHDLRDDATFWRVGFAGQDLSGRAAESVEFEQCRLHNVELAATQLVRATFTDCGFEGGNLANLSVERSAARRVELISLRMTGLSWTGGLLRDVTVRECRADLTSFRFTEFRNTGFDRCNLARADFEHANLSGVRFVDCDLTAAQFSNSTLTGTRFVNCDLTGIGGITSFTGAVLVGGDLVTLANTMAAALGIRLADLADED